MKLAPSTRFVLKHLEFGFNYHQIGIQNYMNFNDKIHVHICFLVFHKFWQHEKFEDQECN